MRVDLNVEGNELDPLAQDSNDPSASKEQMVRNRLHSLNRDDQEQGKGRHESSSKQKLKSKDAAFLDNYLTSKLVPTKKSICEGMVFAMERSQSSAAISGRILDQLRSLCT